LNALTLHPVQYNVFTDLYGIDQRSNIDDFTIAFMPEQVREKLVWTFDGIYFIDLRPADTTVQNSDKHLTWRERIIPLNVIND
jgi:hypothetical protein